VLPATSRNHEENQCGKKKQGYINRVDNLAHLVVVVGVQNVNTSNPDKEAGITPGKRITFEDHSQSSSSP
jgi:hypothetical protein